MASTTAKLDVQVLARLTRECPIFETIAIQQCISGAGQTNIRN
jgi:hypothetical protein